MECPICKSVEFAIYKDRAICFKCQNKFTFWEYPESFDWSKPAKIEETTDAMGRKYFHIWFDVVTNSVVCIDGVNRTFEGIPQVIMRNGDSAFGNEVVLQFVIKGEKPSYNASSPYNHIEMYLPKEQAISIFEKMLKKLKEEKK